MLYLITVFVWDHSEGVDSFALLCEVLIDYLVISLSPLCIKCGAPQGSVLGPLFIFLYMVFMATIIYKRVINFHCDIDDTQYVDVRHLLDFYFVY